jgi:hypothetical protein
MIPLYAFAQVLLCFLLSLSTQARQPSGEWRFAISGDSRNCGDVVMPAIAAGAKRDGAEFYWHLGDLRAIDFPDEDYVHEPEHRAERKNDLVLLNNYEKNAWQDFIESQLAPFGEMPVYIGIGNHEAITPKNRDGFMRAFFRWLNQPGLAEQRATDNPPAAWSTYYHWKQRGIDFIYLDNATTDQFDAAQMRWVQGVLARDESDSEIKTIVVGMHEALPDSIAINHSMSNYESGRRSGRQLYAELLRLRSQGKRVYVLASHSHFFMDGIFNTEYWRSHGGVLPGWIVGTAGAHRYKLPVNSADAKIAKTNVYGYLLAIVQSGAEIRFQFKEIDESDIPESVIERFSPAFVHQCFVGNHD